MEYTININVNGEADPAESPIASAANTAPPDSKDKVKKGGAVTFIASKAIAPMVRSVTSHVTSSVSIATGSTELQQKTDFAMQLINTGTSAVSSIGAATAILGSIGAGAVVGIITTAISYATNIAIKQAQINQRARLESENLSLYRSRFGAAYNMSRNGGTE